MKKSIVVAAMALGVILAAGVAHAQQHVFWLAPGERVDYVGAVDDWTGSPAQRSIEGTRSLITGPINDLNRHINAANGRPDPYYGTGVSPASAPYRNGASAYDGRGYGYSNYGYDNRGYDRGYRRPSGYSNGRYHGYTSRRYDNRRGYSRPATQADVRGWGAAAVGATVLSTIVSEVRADRRHKEEMGELEDLREQNQQQSEPARRVETPRGSESRAYYGDTNDRPAPSGRYTVVNDLGSEACINGTLLAHGGRTQVADPNNIVIAPPPGRTICMSDARFVSQDTILVTCKKGKE